MRLPRIAHWEIAAGLTAVAAGLWIRRDPAVGWAVVAAVSGAWSVVAAFRRRSFAVGATTVAAVALALGMLVASYRVRRVERAWPEVREELIERASQRLDRTLASALDLARRLAERGIALEAESQAEAFDVLRLLIASDAPEHGVVVFDGEGRPWSWAGRHRVPARPGGNTLSVRITPFYVLLEARRQTPGSAAVGHVVLAADSAVPDRERTVAERFATATGSTLEFYTPAEAPAGTDVFDWCLPQCNVAPDQPPPDTLISVRAAPPSQGAVKLDLVASGRRWAAVLSLVLLCTLAVGGGVLGRWAGLGGLVALLVFTPTGERIGLGTLFSSAYYFHGLLGPFSASAGALLVVAATALIGLVSTTRRAGPRRLPAATVGVLLALGAPYLLWTLARGITPPATDVGIGLWLSWQITFTAVGAAVGLAAARLLGGEPPPRWQPWLGIGGVLWAAALGGLGLVLWRPTGAWPTLYGLLWVPAVLLVIQPTGRGRQVVGITAVAGTAAVLLTWGAVLHGTLGLAERDVRRLMGGDPIAMGFLDRFGAQLSGQAPPTSAAQLYAEWRRSPLSQQDYPSALATWGPDGRRVASLELAELELRPALYAAMAAAARESGRPVLRAVELEPGVHYVTAVPFPDGTVVTAGVAPRTRLIRPVLVGRFLRGERRLVAPYELSLGELVPASEVADLRWERSGWTVRAVETLDVPGGQRHLHAEVRLRDVSQLTVRALLLIVADLAFIGLVVVVGEGLAGRLRVPTPLREIVGFRSYRIRLTLVLAAFFVIPTLGFAGWSIGRVGADAARSRDLLIQQTLRDGVRTAQQFTGLPSEQVEARLRDLAERHTADFLWYEDGQLAGSSVPVLAELGLLGVHLPGDIFRSLNSDQAVDVTGDLSIGGQPTRVGYRAVTGAGPRPPVLATPRLVDVSNLLREQEDLAFGLLLVTILGLAGAAALAAFAARSLARPVQALRRAANLVGRGERLPPFGPDIPTEFVSVMDAFERMARDVEASQHALDAARRRTATVLSTVATGVLALDPGMQLTIANPKAEEILGCSLKAGEHIGAATEAAWMPVWEWVRTFLGDSQEADAREFSMGERRIHVQVAALHADPGGCVVALDDTTDLTRAVRVLAWGELARQIAHEIKNPLTPIRLGVQHLQRARRHGRTDFDATLERTSEQILAEIERLDAIARAFARFGAPPEEGVPLTAADLSALARDAAALYALSGDARVLVEAAGPVTGLVRADEVKEVLINLIENARDAGARTVTITVSEAGGGGRIEVRDDGRGITAEHMTRVFEPQFSTTSSGTGLGLAICKRLVESWGGSIDVHSEVGAGTRVIVWAPGADGGTEAG